MNTTTEKFVTVLTVTYPSELAVARSLLESEGIDCFVKNELAVQSYSVLSNAMGGVELQVLESDLPQAIAILKEAGYLKDDEQQSPDLITRLEKFTLKIPVLNNLHFGIRLLILLIVVGCAITAIFYFSTMPTKYERLTQFYWCMDNVTYAGKDYLPQNLYPAGLFSPCRDGISFAENGIAVLPGFLSSPVTAMWRLENGNLHISEADTFGFVYDGSYELDFSGNQLVLKSATATLSCHSEPPVHYYQ